MANPTTEEAPVYLPSVSDISTKASSEEVKALPATVNAGANGTPTESPVYLPSVSDINTKASPEELKSILEDRPKKTEDLIAEFYAQAGMFGKYIGYGDKEMARAVAGVQAADGDITPEEAQSNFGHQAMELWKDQNVSALQSSVSFPALQQVLAPVAEMLPALKEYAEGTGMGAAIGGTLGAVGGTIASGGNPVGGLLLGAGGAALGAEAGIVNTAYHMGKGQLMMDLLDRDVPPSVAIPIARVGGLLIGAANLFGVGTIAGKGIAGIASMFSGEEAQAALQSLAGKMLEQGGIGATYAGLQSITNSMSKALAGMISHKQGVITTKEMVEGLAANVLLGAGLGIGAAGISHFLEGSVTKALKLKTEAHKKFVESNLPQELKDLQMEQAKQEAQPEKEVTGKVLTKAEKELANFHEMQAEYEEVSTQLAHTNSDITLLKRKLAQYSKALETLYPSKKARDKVLKVTTPEYMKQQLLDLENDYAADLEKQEALEKDINLVEAQRLKAAKERLKDLIGEIKPPAEGSRMGRKTNAQDVLDLVKYYYNNPEKVFELQAEYDLAQAKTEGKPVEETAEQQMDRDAANLVGDWKNKDSEELEDLIKQIEDTYQEGRRSRIDEIASNLNKRNARKAMVLKAMKESNDVDSGSEQPTKYPLTPMGAFRDFIGGWAFNWRGGWYLLMRKSPGWKQIYKAILDPGKLIDAVNLGVERQEYRRYELLAEATGRSKADILELERIGRRKNAIVLSYTDAEGRIRETGRTLLQATKMLAELADPAIADDFIEQNGFSPDLKDILIRELDLADIAYRKMIPAYAKWYQEYHPEVAAAVKKDKGLKLPKNPHYPGTILRARNPKTGTTEFEAELRSRVQQGRVSKTAARKPGFIQERRHPDMNILPQDIAKAARDYNRLAQQYINWWEPSKEIFGPIARDTEIRNTARNLGKEDVLKSVDRGLEYLVSGSAKEDIARTTFIDDILAAIRFNDLANNWLYGPKHLFSSITGSNFIPFSDYMQGLGEYWLNPIGHGKEMLEVSIAARKRYMDISNAESGKNLPKTLRNPNWPKPVADAMDAYHAFGLGALTLGSKGQVFGTMWSIYRYGLKQGLSKEEAIYDAAIAAESLATSSRADMTSSIAHTPAGSSITFLQQQAIHFAQMQIIAVDQFFARPSVETAKEAIKTVAITHVGLMIFPLVNDIYAYMVAEDKDKKDEAVFRMQMDAFYKAPFVGRSLPLYDWALTSVMTKYHNEKAGTNYSVFDYNIAIIDALNNTKNFAAMFYQDLAEGKWDDESKDKLGTAYGRTPLGVGTKHPYNFYEKVKANLFKHSAL